MKLSDFDFKLPDELIALNPAKPRDSSKLLRVNSSDFFEDTTFSQLTNFLNDGDVLVVNDTKVIPSKIIGFKVNAEKELTRISFTFFENKENGQWKSLGKPNAEDLNSKTYFVTVSPDLSNWQVPDPNFVENVKKNINKDKTILVMCAAGGRSLIAANLLAAEGYSTLNVSDGFSGNGQDPGWKNLGLPSIIDN